MLIKKIAHVAVSVLLIIIELKIIFKILMEVAKVGMRLRKGTGTRGVGILHYGVNCISVIHYTLISGNI